MSGVVQCGGEESLIMAALPDPISRCLSSGCVGGSLRGILSCAASLLHDHDPFEAEKA